VEGATVRVRHAGCRYKAGCEPVCTLFRKRDSGHTVSRSKKQRRRLNKALRQSDSASGSGEESQEPAEMPASHSDNVYEAGSLSDVDGGYEEPRNVSHDAFTA
jgi:hypothetical protein